MNKLVLLRHGESEWNKKRLFTGWTDVDLSEEGIKEVHEAGKVLKKEGYIFDLALTSYLKRAIHSLWIVLDELEMPWLPVIKDWRLNERHYGALQGYNKDEMISKHGEEQVHLWRRGYSVKPPVMKDDDPHLPANEFKYAKINKKLLPRGEALMDTRKRVSEYWEKYVIPHLQNKQKLLIVAHGNSLRALVMMLEDLDDKAITKLEIPTGNPFVYKLDDNLKPVDKKKYLL